MNHVRTAAAAALTLVLAPTAALAQEAAPASETSVYLLLGFLASSSLASPAPPYSPPRPIPAVREVNYAARLDGDTARFAVTVAVEPRDRPKRPSRSSRATWWCCPPSCRAASGWCAKASAIAC